MNRIAFSLALAAALFVITACTDRNAAGKRPVTGKVSAKVICGNAGDPFRLYMEKAYGPSYPPSPTPIPPAKIWVDVQNWQCFLDSKGYPATDPPNDTFNPTIDVNATELFQKWAMAHGYPHITPNGVVDQYTYNAAVGAGMTPYPTYVTPLTSRRRHRHHPTNVRPSPTPAQR